MNDVMSKGGNHLMGKLLVLAILVLVSWAATMFVWNVIQERKGLQEVASAAVAEQWGRAQIIAGPVLVIPLERTYLSQTGESAVTNSNLFLLPKNLHFDGEVKTQVRSKGVYDTPVYTAMVKGTGEFDLADIGGEDLTGTKILWDKAEIAINVSDPRGITTATDFNWNDNSLALQPASKFSVLEKSGMHTSVPVDEKQPRYTFEFDLSLRGSNDLSFLPLGGDTKVSLKSDWPAPSFSGEFLPEAREVTPLGFTANWSVASFGKNIPQSWQSNATAVSDEVLLTKAFGVGLFQEVNFYTMVDRSIKYSILFISLTFLTFFLYEVLAGLRIHPVQYLLVGLAIALFYLLLLSVAEIVGFLPAYLISTLSVTTLITGYCVSVLKVKKRAFTIMALLIALYSYLYILLQLEDWALLFGSVFLFGVLGTVMYITRNLDWYSIGNRG